jgi:hypothetical protein
VLSIFPLLEGRINASSDARDGSGGLREDHQRPAGAGRRPHPRVAHADVVPEPLVEVPRRDRPAVYIATGCRAIQTPLKVYSIIDSPYKMY